MNFNATTRLLTVLLAGMYLSTACAAETAPVRDSTPPLDSANVGLLGQTMLKLEEQSFTLGLAYLQVTYKSTHANASGNTQITDNGAPSPILEMNSAEKVLQRWSLPLGSAIIGWDINASASTFDTHYQLLNSAFRGQDIGTKVSGGYLGVAPTVFLKMGPLYAGRDIYWKVGYGIGPGLFQGSGTAYFNNGSTYDVGSPSAVLALYQSINWQFQVDHWNVYITGKILVPQGSERSSLEAYGAGLAYRFNF